MNSTTDILRARAALDDGLGRTYAISAAVHGVFVVLIFIVPSGFLTSGETEVMANVMSISLGGPAGASQGGQTALAAQPVQELLPLEEANRDQWVQPPAPAPPEEIVPTPEAPRRPERDLPIESAPEESRGRTPTRGPELREGSALADTGARGAGEGLSAGGLGSGGYLEVGDFCCPEYLGVMLQVIQGRWNNRQEFTGAVMMKFTIQRDGQIIDILRESRGRTPTRGPELREGSALADTGARGAGEGLSAGGLGSGGYLEVGDFCCPEYLGVMKQLIQGRWNNRQEFTGEVMMKFTIQRDGQITDILRETDSGYLALNQSAERALRLVGKLPPLPSRFSEDHLTVHLNFEYQR